MISPNIEVFNLICVRIFSDLYEAFPVPIALEPEALAASAIPKYTDYAASWSASDIAYEAIIFLKQEGFLVFGGSVLSGGFYEVRLTMKGLAVLGSVPVTLLTNEPREPIINKIGKIMGKGAEKVASETVQAIVSEVFKFAMASGVAVSAGIINV